MASCWRKFMGCWRPSRSQYVHMNRDEDSSLGREDDPLLWCRDLEKHYYGEFSFAVVQANHVIEDHSQVETVKELTFAGVYDGHGGDETSRYVARYLFKHLIRIAKERGKIDDDIIKDAFSETEKGFLSVVNRAFEIEPSIAANGSCVLVGIIWKGTLYVANLGDSRAVLGVLNHSRKITADQLTQEHNAGYAAVREQLRSLHPDVPDIVVKKKGAWRVKGIIQVSRAIGDAYLKRPEFALGPSSKFHLPEPITEAVLRSDPQVYFKQLNPEDKFLILASDGLWEHLSNQKVVDIVHNNPRPGIARRLIKLALIEAARKAERSYEALKQLGTGVRRTFHDDISVIVIFIDHEGEEPFSVLSVKGFRDNEPSSSVNLGQGIELMQVKPNFSIGESSGQSSGQSS